MFSGYRASSFLRPIFDFGLQFGAPQYPPYGMVPKLAFWTISHEKIVFAFCNIPAVVVKPANSFGFLQPASRKCVIHNHLALTSSAAPCLFLCQIFIQFEIFFWGLRAWDHVSLLIFWLIFFSNKPHFLSLCALNLCCLFSTCIILPHGLPLVASRRWYLMLLFNIWSYVTLL